MHAAVQLNSKEELRNASDLITLKHTKCTHLSSTIHMYCGHHCHQQLNSKENNIAIMGNRMEE